MLALEAQDKNIYEYNIKKNSFRLSLAVNVCLTTQTTDVIKEKVWILSFWKHLRLIAGAANEGCLRKTVLYSIPVVHLILFQESLVADKAGLRSWEDGFRDYGIQGEANFLTVHFSTLIHFY